MLQCPAVQRERADVNDQISFGPPLQIASSLIDGCIIEWSLGKGDEIRPLVMRAFRCFARWTRPHIDHGHRFQRICPLLRARHTEGMTGTITTGERRVMKLSQFEGFEGPILFNRVIGPSACICIQIRPTRKPGLECAGA
ncbi:DUF3164 family protein [Rhizobium phaseoli]|uniref:DUF3164 family protein n=1 Tax=Rhizobium phaseoli TaxID=396 RepID=UPI001FE19063|nr:DUF3164 family protein [Rhizobium phaseoli]